MYYRDNLKKFRDTDLKVWEILAANEVDFFDIERQTNLTDEQFEAVVDFVYDWIIHTDMSVVELCELIFNLVNDGEFTFDDFTNYEKVDKITDIINRMI